MADIDDMISQAIVLKHRAETEGIGPIRELLVSEIDSLGKQIDLDAMLPGTGGKLGMAAEQRDSESFFNVFSDQIRDNLCRKGGEFNKLIRQGPQSSVGAILTALVMTLGVPMVALSLLVPIAVLICHSGLEAYCKVSAIG